MADWVKSVQRGLISVGLSSATGTLAYSKSQTAADCFCWITQQHFDTDLQNQNCFSCDTQASQIEIERGSASAPNWHYVEAGIVEVESSEVSVQKKSFQITNGNGTATATISSVDTDYAFAFGYMRTTASDDDWGDCQVEFDFQNSTTLRVTRQTTDHTFDVIAYVVEATAATKAFSVATYTGDTGTNTFPYDVTITAVDPNKTFLVCSYGINQSDDDADSAAVTFELLNSTTVRLHRGSTTDTTAIHYTIFVVETTSDGVQRGSFDHEVSGTETDTITAVDLDVSVIKGNASGGYACTGTADTTAFNGVSYAMSKYTLPSSTQAKGEGRASTFDCVHQWEVIEFGGAPPPVNKIPVQCAMC